MITDLATVNLEIDVWGANLSWSFQTIKYQILSGKKNMFLQLCEVDVPGQFSVGR